MSNSNAYRVGLEFAGVNLIWEYAKAPNFFITEINGNPGTGIIDITGYNYFVDLIMYIETKTGQTAQPPTDSSTPATTEPQEEARQYPAEYVALQQMDQYGQRMTVTQSGMLAFFRVRYGRIRIQQKTFLFLNVDHFTNTVDKTELTGMSLLKSIRSRIQNKQTISNDELN